MKKITILSLLVIIIDRIIKVIVSTNMQINSSLVVIKNFLNITYVENTGAAFSILEGNKILLIIVAMISLTLIYLFLIKGNELVNIEIASYGLLIGGIIGNLIDRILYGSVIDFLDFNLFGYHFPIFNIADIAIVLGALILIFIVVKENKGARNNSK